MERRDKINYYLDIAETVTERATCLRRCWGAVIVKNDEIISTGYNGAPRGRQNCTDLGYCIREKLNIPRGERYELCRSVHAEQNAIIQAGQDRCMGSSMYIYGHNFICILCKRFIVQAGIETIYLKKDDNSPIEVVTAQQLRDELSEVVLEKTC